MLFEQRKDDGRAAAVRRVKEWVEALWTLGAAASVRPGASVDFTEGPSATQRRPTWGRQHGRSVPPDRGGASR